MAVDLLAGGVTAYRPTAADEGNRAYAAVAAEEGGRLLEMPVYAPDRQEASVYLLRDAGAARAPAGYSTVAPKEAARVLRELSRARGRAQPGQGLGVRYLAVYGRPQCGVAGRLVARDGPIALYEAFMPVAW